MLKVIGGSFLGLLLCAAGVIVFYIFLTGIDNGGNPWIILGAIPLIGGGVFLLYKLGKSDSTVVFKAHLVASNKEGVKSILEKNNEISEEWSRTVEKKDRMKVVKIAAAAQEQAQKGEGGTGD